MDNTKFLKTLLAVVEKQQAALKKMAAKKMGQGSPFYEGTDDPKDPNYWDPLNSTIKRDPSVAGPPGAPGAAKPGATPTGPKAAPASDFASKLNADPTFAKLKGNLQLVPDPKNPSVFDVKYYTGAWGQGATALQKALSTALPGYRINNPVGYMRLDFQPNYVA
jgi:hypothetical protein